LNGFEKAITCVLRSWHADSPGGENVLFAPMDNFEHHQIALNRGGWFSEYATHHRIENKVVTMGSH
jgi:hypothetical protein